MKEPYVFTFSFTTREQFYDVVRILQQECGRGNWTIRGKVLKNIKHIEELSNNCSKYNRNNSEVRRKIVVPYDKRNIEALLQLKYAE